MNVQVQAVEESAQLGSDRFMLCPVQYPALGNVKSCPVWKDLLYVLSVDRLSDVFFMFNLKRKKKHV